MIVLQDYTVGSSDLNPLSAYCDFFIHSHRDMTVISKMNVWNSPLFPLCREAMLGIGVYSHQINYTMASISREECEIQSLNSSLLGKKRSGMRIWDARFLSGFYSQCQSGTDQQLSGMKPKAENWYKVISSCDGIKEPSCGLVLTGGSFPPLCVFYSFLGLDEVWG